MVVPVGPMTVGSLVLPEGARGEWHELLAGEDTELGRVVQFQDVLSPLGLGLLERR